MKNNSMQVVDLVQTLVHGVEHQHRTVVVPLKVVNHLTFEMSFIFQDKFH